MAERRQVATLGGGCFWCLDAAYRRIEIVINPKLAKLREKFASRLRAGA